MKSFVGCICAVEEGLGRGLGQNLLSVAFRQLNQRPLAFASGLCTPTVFNGTSLML